MDYKSKWTRNNILSFLEENYPDISFKIMGMSKFSPLQIGNFAHNKYGRLFAHKIYIKREGKTIITFKTEKLAKNKKGGSNPKQSNKAFMNEWIKKSLNKSIV